MSDNHIFSFNISEEGVEFLSAERHSTQRRKGFLVYLHPNTMGNLCPINVWAGQDIGGISTNKRAGDKANVLEVLESESIRYQGRQRYRTCRLIGIATTYSERLEITQPSGHLICQRIYGGLWRLEVAFEVGKNIPTYFQKISPYLLPIY